MSGTGYTYPVLEGEITTFEEFAKRCMSAFLMQMRDGDEFKPMQPDDYYLQEVQRCETEIQELVNISDHDLLRQREDRLKKR